MTGLQACAGETPYGDPCPCRGYAHQFAKYCPICEHSPSVVTVDLLELADQYRPGGQR